MCQNHSLQDFSEATADGQSDVDPDHSQTGGDERRDGKNTGTAGDDRSPEDDGETTADPMAATYSAGEGTCGACGHRVETRWRSEGSLVCTDCKEW